MFKKYKRLISFIILTMGLVLVGFYGYKFYCNSKFDSALSDSRKISSKIWDDKYQDVAIKNSYKVVFISNNGGEYTYSEYFKYAAEKKGWEVKIFYNQVLGHEQEVLDFDPDFIIFSQFAEITPDISTAINAHRSKKYLLSFSSIDALRNRFKWISMRDPYLAKGNFKKYLTMIHGVLTISPELGFYHRMFDKLNKPFNGLQIFPLVPQVINDPAEPKKLMWLSGGWDKFRSSENYRNFIKKLSENVPMKVYGHYNSSSYLTNNVYGGYIPPGVANIEAIRKNGIYLLTHSDSHFKGGEPNMRGFEAAAANAIVISDKHPFIVEHFGDSFLYFDHTASSEEMYRQVKAHIDWVMANPEKAKTMADKAHKIFLEKFTLEKDLVRIAKMHEAIISQEQDNFKLDYSFSY